MSSDDIKRHLDRRTLADLQARLDTARPDALSAIVALIDRLPERGDTDALLAPLRPRLTTMRDMIRRPASLGRVLAMPIEALLVPPDLWRRGSISVPRSVLPTAIALVGHAMGPERRQAVQRRLSGTTMEDAAAVREAGEAVWPAAAARLCDIATLPLPAGVALPMREADLRIVLASIGETLHIATPLAAVLLETPRGAGPSWVSTEPRLRAVLGAAMAQSALCFARVGLILMRRLIAAGPVIALLREAAGQSRTGEAERTLSAALDCYLAELPEQIPDPASLALLPAAVQQSLVLETVSTIEHAAAEIGTWQASRRENLRAVQAQMSAVLRQRVPECISHDLLAPLARLHAEGLRAPGGAAAIEDIEATARAAGAMAAAARRLGAADDLAIAVRRAASEVAAMALAAPPGAPGDRPGRADYARIVEIMAGPDQAERVLTQLE